LHNHQRFDIILKNIPGEQYEKIVFTILALGFSLIVLSGCQTREDSSDWLQGDWYSKDWNVTYTIIKQDENDWEI
jgi:hypothetical protein